MTDNWEIHKIGEPAIENPLVPDSCIDYANWKASDETDRYLTIYRDEQSGLCWVVRYEGEHRTLESEEWLR